MLQSVRAGAAAHDVHDALDSYQALSSPDVRCAVSQRCRCATTPCTVRPLILVALSVLYRYLDGQPSCPTATIARSPTVFPPAVSHGPVHFSTQTYHVLDSSSTCMHAGAVASMPSEYIAGASNYYSYHAIDMYLFLGFTPQLTKLRRHLKLPAWPNPSTAPAHSITNLKIPFTYLWSPSLQPKPSDWAGHLGVRALRHHCSVP